MVHLADYMTANGLSDDEVAKGISRTRPTVSRIRRKLVRPDWDTLEEIKKFTKGESSADDYTTLNVSRRKRPKQFKRRAAQ